MHSQENKEKEGGIMKKRNIWIPIAIILGILIVGMLAIYAYMLIIGRNYYDEYNHKMDEETVSKNAAKIETDGTNEYEEIRQDGFAVSTKVKLTSEDKTKLDEDTDESEDESEDSDENRDEMGDTDYIIPDSDKRRLTESDLEDLTPRELTYARNEIYARHGRKFQSRELQKYFDSMEWYEMDESFDDRDLQGVERQNAEFISNYQKDNGKTYKVN